MFSEAKSAQAWDLADPRTMRSNFSSASFYIVIDGLEHPVVQQTAKSIKAALTRAAGVRVRGPLALPTVRRRHIILSEAPSNGSRGLYCSNAKRIRNVLLVESPTSESIMSLVALPLPATVNIKIESYQSQYDLKEAK
ncbi:30S ribosomal protein S10 [Pseudomonas putida]|uniref:30S ribosomal protein S10 n=1 Tax=Pseudomonas putida TaxID=303 RepID=UPI0037F58B94